MSKRDDLATRAARVTARGRGVPDAPAPKPAPVKKDKVRITVDLAPLLYRTLTHWCGSAADELGRAKLPAAEVIRALIDELDTSDELTARIMARLRDGSQ